jgi:hypothetical protein
VRVGGNVVFTKIQSVTKDSVSAYRKQLRGQNLWKKIHFKYEIRMGFDVFIGGDSQE